MDGESAEEIDREPVEAFLMTADGIGLRTQRPRLIVPWNKAVYRAAQDREDAAQDALAVTA